MTNQTRTEDGGMTYLNEVEEKALKHIQMYGADTTRVLNRLCGPGWRGLVRSELALVHHGLMGEVATLAPEGLALCQQRGHHAYRLLSPGAATDRAFQVATVRQLFRESYTGWPELSIYKRRSAGLGLRGYTSIITALTVQTSAAHHDAWGRPRLTYQELRDAYDGSHPPYNRDGGYQALHGMPLCYATISNGGIKLPAIKRIYKYHDKRFDYARWHHGVIIAVPEETPDIRHYARHVNAQGRREPLVHKGRTYPCYDHLVIIEVPVPGLTQKRG